MRRCFIVLFVLVTTILSGQVPNPENMSFSGLAEYINNFKFIGSGTVLPAIQPKGVQWIDWSNPSYPQPYISNGSNWVEYRGVELDSAGCLIEPTFTDNGDGTITVDACCVALYNNILGEGKCHKYNFNEISFNLIDNAENYIVADFNSGTPILKNVIDTSSINETTVVPILTIYYHDGHLHSLNWDTLGIAITNKLHQRLVKTNRFAREPYGLGVVVATNTLDFTIDKGVVWFGATKTIISTYTSNIDLLHIILPNGTSIATTTLNNTFYESNNVLTQLNPNHYSVNWIYRGIQLEKMVYLMIGQEDYKLLDARSATPPPAPAIIANHTLLVAKIIFEKGTTNAYIQLVTDGEYNIVAAQIHNELLCLNGGDYQHLTVIEKDTALNGSYSVDLKAKNFSATGTTTLATTTIHGDFRLGPNDLVYDDNSITTSNVNLPAVNAPSFIDYKSSNVLGFSPTASDLVYFSTQLSHRYKVGSNIEFHIHVAYPTTNIATSTWQFTYSWANLNSDIFPTATTLTINLPSSGVIDKHIMHHIVTISGAGKTESSVLLCSLKRLGTDGADTYASNIYFVSADFHYTIDKLGERDGNL